MGRFEVKKIVRRCVSHWSGNPAKQTDRLDNLKNVTAATRRQLARRINRHPDLAPCGEVIDDAQVTGGMRVTDLGQQVWNNKQGCLRELP